MPDKIKRKLGLKMKGKGEEKGQETPPEKPAQKMLTPPPKPVSFQNLTTARIVVSEMVYHQQPGKDAKAVTSKFTRLLDSEEQIYIRETEATTRWVHVDIGWVKQVGQLIVKNSEPRILYVVPTEEQRAALEAHTLDIGVKPEGSEEPTAFGMIRPGESARFEPHNDNAIWVRSREKKVRITVTAIPE